MRISKQEDDMILSDRTMDKMIKEGTLVVRPITEGQIQPASIDIRLGNTFSIVDDTPSGIITLENEIKYKTITTDTYLIMPGQFVLATTMEYFELPDNLTAFVEGRSSLGRMGLFIQNAGWVDPGFKGEITLELFNANKCAIELKAGRGLHDALTTISNANYGSLSNEFTRVLEEIKLFDILTDGGIIIVETRCCT